MSLKPQITLLSAMMLITTACSDDKDKSAQACHSVCANETTILLCDDNAQPTLEASCKYGCLNDECVPAPEQEKCTKSVCSDDKTLAQCDTHTGSISSIECKYGCTNDKCGTNPDAPIEKCTKTYCIDSTTLSECDTQTGSATENICKNGCSDNKCLPAPETNNCTVSVCKNNNTLLQCNAETGTTTELDCIYGCKNARCNPLVKPDFSAFIEQPTTEYYTTTMAKRQGTIDVAGLPDPAPILAANRDTVSKYGLYAWAWEYTVYKEAVADVGFGYIRFGGTLSDDAMKVIASHPEQKIFYTYSIKVNDGESDEDYINRYITGLLNALKTYGPNGTFFKNNSDVPYRPLQAVEIMNEPNFGYMIPGNSNESNAVTEEKRQKLYAKLLPAAYDAVKKDYPDVTVIGFGAGGASAGDQRFVIKVLEFNPEVINKMDIFSTHPYVNGSPFCYSIQSWGQYSITSVLSAHRKVFEKYGRPNIPVLYSEMGWQITKADGGKYDVSASGTVTPTVQAANIIQTYLLTMRINVLSASIMFTVDTDGYNGGFFSNGNYRTSAEAVKTMHSLLPAPKLVAIRSDGEDGVFSYDVEAEKDGRVLTMLFAPEGARTYNFATTASVVTVTDMIGNTTTFNVENGSIALPAGPCPLYIDEATTEIPNSQCDCSTKLGCSDEELASCDSAENE